MPGYFKKHTLYIYIYIYIYKEKSGILPGFLFLRALRICSSNFVNVKFEHIKKSFSKLQYSVSYIH